MEAIEGTTDESFKNSKKFDKTIQKMTVKVITRHAPSNYGSLLQSIATQTVLEHLGYECKMIDYQRKDERGIRMVLNQVSRKKDFSSPLKKLFYIIIRYPVEKYAQCRFDRMRNRYLKMTKRCTTPEDLSQLKADAFMTGSDQVWGPVITGMYDAAYFLQFATGGAKRLSYAASFGKTNFDAATTRVYQQMLASYDKITVREDSAVQMLESWGAKNCYGQVLDPTLLLSADEWIDLLVYEEMQIKYASQKYILVYQIHNDRQLSSYALRLAAHTGLKLLRVNPFMHQVHRGGKFVLCPDVTEFLSLIKNATYIVTDSFHGTCFSLTFEKQFIEVLPNNTTGTRNQSILALTGLSNRIVYDFDDFSIINRMINYQPVREILAKERGRSVKMLKCLLNS
ncbi:MULTISPECIES: polysaccharide pyruvyl transferase family protein [Bacteroides]|jgi:hypothetical protein|nr:MULTISPECIES: polysaccharide pyruvyl transferase family protein [Bacteroides]MCS2802868.1 polysaccharide pyruvyl transferase family protein [Bacteroides ovatus]MCS3035047.1 polysaccharide pyruvyl transferase family protein [Bacteroides ovatus]MCS3137142.1 polysaccharide pyruvyl transferase family protein [Bacteroides ovatus]MCZ2711387.1 polysaccharide pyruvyl transferase family protein [Bacteroides ovatus]MDC2574988.1 polysaccharide pyruvyl transferase family protein [Bacteroides ovatus]